MVPVLGKVQKSQRVHPRTVRPSVLDDVVEMMASFPAHRLIKV